MKSNEICSPARSCTDVWGTASHKACSIVSCVFKLRLYVTLFPPYPSPHTTCSASSPSSSDANLRFPDSNGLLQTARWDEPQRACALEQICGVFRVDLGHMRSLRLFFR